MGTDITAEIHVLKNNFWKECRNQDCLDAVNKQSYEFFALLAGVRNEEFEFIPIVKEPKGLPEDIQRKLNDDGFEYEWNGAEWGISWVTLQEILSDPCAPRRLRNPARRAAAGPPDKARYCLLRARGNR